MSDIRLAPSLIRAAGIAALVALAGCSMDKQDPPALTGPSEYGRSLAITASPDAIAQDGASQSVIGILARDEANQPLSNLALRMDIVVNGASANDFGRLSAHNVTTGSDGRATVVYTAPPRPPDDNDPESTIVQVFVTPVGTNFDAAVGRSVSIRLFRASTIYVPGTPVAVFTYAPSVPRALQYVYFDASMSNDSDGSIVSYQWSYGDGDVETGVMQDHDFTTAGTYNVTLTVVDNSGKRASTTRMLTVQ